MLCADLAAAVAPELPSGPEGPGGLQQLPHQQPQLHAPLDVQALTCVLAGALRAARGQGPYPGDGAVTPTAPLQSSIGGSGKACTLIVLAGQGQCASLVAAAGAAGWEVDQEGTAEMARVLHSLPPLVDGVVPLMLHSRK